MYISSVVDGGQGLLRVPTFFLNSPRYALDAAHRFAIVPDGCFVSAVGRGDVSQVGQFWILQMKVSYLANITRN